MGDLRIDRPKIISFLSKGGSYAITMTSYSKATVISRIEKYVLSFITKFVSSN